MRLPSDRTTLILLNLAVIFCAETFGGGTFFYDYRIIQILGLIFVVLAVVRLTTDYRIFDPAQRKLVRASLLAMLLFSASQVLAYFVRAYRGLSADLSDDILLASMVNLYLSGMLLLMVGCGSLLRSRPSGIAAVLTRAPVVLLFALSVDTVLFTFMPEAVDVFEGSWITYGGAAFAVVVSGAAFVTLRMLGRSVKVLRSFSGHFVVGILLLGISAVFTVFHESLFARGVPVHQFEYLNFFLFSAALSAIFLAFGQLKGMGGIYQDLAEEAKKLGIE